MKEEVTQYIEKQKPWQVKTCTLLRKMAQEVVKDVEERLQYGKPHYLKNGHYVAVIHVGKDKVSFMVFNASEIQEEQGFLRSMGDGDRKTADFIEGQEPDITKLSEVLKQTSRSL
jgi:hypothetical protein